MTVDHDPYSEYLESVILTQLDCGNWRLGQTAFNVLREMRPDIAEQVRGSELDPFYSGTLGHAGADRVARFLTYVEEVWDDRESQSQIA